MIKDIRYYLGGMKVMFPKIQLYLKAWDCEEEVLVTIRKRTSGSNGKMTICYKKCSYDRSGKSIIGFG